MLILIQGVVRTLNVCNKRVQSSIVAPANIVFIELAAVARVADLIAVVVDDARVFQEESEHVDLTAS